MERGKEDMTFNPTTNQYEAVIRKLEKDKVQPKVDYIPGMDKVRDRMERARQQQLEKKLMTERGIPAQIAADLGKVSKPLSFQPQTSKFKSAFGDKDGSQIKPKLKDSQYLTFHDSQPIDASKFSSNPYDGPRHTAQRAAALLQPKLQHSQESPDLVPVHHHHH
jgi:hypothetical protein